MGYVEPTLSVGNIDNNSGVEAQCTPGLAVAVAVAGVVWNVGGVYNYVGITVAAVVAAAAFVAVGTKCFGK